MTLTLKKVPLAKVVTKQYSRGAYNDVADQVIALADTQEGVVITDINEDEFRKQLIPAVRRIVGQRLGRQLNVGVVDGVDGFVVYAGAPVVKRPPLTDAQKKQRAEKRAANKAAKATKAAA